MQTSSLQEVIERIVRKDPRYDRDAYLFVREALDHTLRSVRGSQPEAPRNPSPTGDGRSSPARRHVSGQELLKGIRDLALQQFGPLAKTVLEHWGVTRCEDFGEIVFNMVDAGLLGKTPQDSRQDFVGGYDFDEAFVRPFRPRRRVVV